MTGLQEAAMTTEVTPTTADRSEHGLLVFVLALVVFGVAAMFLV